MHRRMCAIPRIALFLTNSLRNTGQRSRRIRGRCAAHALAQVSRAKAAPWVLSP